MKAASDRRHQRRIGRIGHEMHRQLARDVRRRLGAHRQIVQHRQNRLQTLAAIGLAQHRLGPRFSHLRIKHKRQTGLKLHSPVSNSANWRTSS